MFYRHLPLLLYMVLIPFLTMNAQESKPLRLGVAGLSHGHVGWILGREDLGDIVLVGIVETDKELVQKLADQFGFSKEIVYETLPEMIAATTPQAVAAFGTIKDHLGVIETCAPKGIHVMVEKPMAMNLKEAKRMETLAKTNQIHLLTNYETSWYPTNEKAHQLLKEGKIGALRKVIVRDGHKGPKKIGVPPEFLQWLTDPTLSGGGAIMDFGCYGANLMTWLQGGERPLSITAVTQQLQAENNPKVDDDATIILTYKSAMAILEPSWNWPIGRKDMEVYGETGAIYADNRNQLRVRMSEGYDGFSEETFQLEERAKPYHDPFSLFAAVIEGKTVLEPYDVYSLENNMITMEILDAALRSAKAKNTVTLPHPQ